MSPRVPAAVGAVLLVLALLLVALRSVDTPRSPAPMPAVASTSAAAGEAIKSPTLMRQSAHPGASTTSFEALRPGEIEICGVGRAMPDTEAAAELDRRAQATLDQGTNALLDSMRASGDAKTRAAAMMVRYEFAPLVRLALSTQDATVYSMALLACDRRAPGAVTGQACQLVSAEQLARLDPDNVMSWLQVATVAKRRSEPGNVAEAMHRASLARIARTRNEEFSQLVMAALPTDMPAHERGAAGIWAIGVQAAFRSLSYSALTQYCSEASIRDGNLRQTCPAIAEVMVSDGWSLLDVMVGRRIGERAGWPVERVASLGNWIEAALGTLLITTDLGPGGPWACENLQALDRYWKLAVEHGETHAARVLLRESSLTQSEIAIVYRDKLKALATQGQAAMATASAASSAASEPNPAPR